jgi:hypothetical protein
VAARQGGAATGQNIYRTVTAAAVPKSSRFPGPPLLVCANFLGGTEGLNSEPDRSH